MASYLFLAWLTTWASAQVPRASAFDQASLICGACRWDGASCTASGAYVFEDAVGIGAAPSSPLQVGADLSEGFDPAEIHQVWIGWETTDGLSRPVAMTQAVCTAASASSCQGMEGQSFLKHPTGHVPLVIGTIGSARTKHGAAATVGEVRGLNGNAVAEGSGGTVTRVVGVQAGAGILGANDVTHLVGVDVSLFDTGSGDPTNVYGVNVPPLPPASGLRAAFHAVDGTYYLGTVPASGGASPLCWDGDGGSFIGACTSSARFKLAIEPLTSAREIVARLRPVRFRWRSTGAPAIGLIAEEVAEVDERLVTRDDEGEPRSVEYHRVTALLVKSVQELTAEVERLRRQVAELEARLEGGG